MSANEKNTAMQELNSYACPLAGNNMISAGAGTGKTYNIQILVLRKILMGTPIEKILVVTFTELATQELQDRIRSILQNALRICDHLVKHGVFKRDALINSTNGAAILEDKTLAQALPCFGLTDDPAKSIHENELPKSLDDIVEKKRFLENALRNFDDAPISTIHGFCNRMLKENTFESGIRYGLELRSSCNALVKSLLCEFYRDFCNKSDNARRFLILKLLKYTPNRIIADIKELLGNADAKINWGDDIPEAICADATSGCTELTKIENASIWDRFPRALQKVSDEELDAFCNNMCFNKDTATFFRQLGDDRWLLYAYDELENKAKNKNKQSLPTAIPENMSQEAQELHAAYLEAFAPAQLQTQDADAKTLPVDSIPWLLDKYRRIILKLAAAYAKRELANAKETEGFMTFEDLLIVLKNRVTCANGEEFRKLIRDRFDCVMIDEFQDTDHTQSTIFKKIFADNDDDAHKRLLIMIGDEKQAIYKFRGGDVQTFQKMTGTAQNKYTLKKNFRSSRDFIDAMNDFWMNECEGHFFEPAAIKFEEIGVGTKDGKCLVGKRDARILSGGALLSRSCQKDKSAVFQELAAEILELKNNYFKATQKEDGKIENADIDFKDIAILVRTKTNVDEIRRTLQNSGIPSVFMQAQSVFKTDECKWMLDFIDAILDPGNQGKALRLLSCELFGFSASQMECINEKHLANFQSFLKEMNALWHKKSFFTMFTRFCNTPWGKQFDIDSGNEALQILAGIPENTPAIQIVKNAADTERSLAILNQVAETLMQVATERHFEPGALYAFLEKKTHDNHEKDSSFTSDENGTNSVTEEENDDEEFPVHLTTQDDAVQILTIHKSKGLEYPFVFIPNFTPQKNNTHRNSIYHDDETEGQSRTVNDDSEVQTRTVNMDFMDAEKQEKCDNEAIAENKRLMYVAITRAKYFCRFIGTTKGLEDSTKKLIEKYRQDGWDGLEEEQRNDLVVVLSEWGDGKKYGKILEYLRDNLPNEMPQALYDELASYKGKISKANEEKLQNAIERCLKALPQELRPTQMTLICDWNKQPDVLLPQLPFPPETPETSSQNLLVSASETAKGTPTAIHAETLPRNFRPEGGFTPTSFSSIAKGKIKESPDVRNAFDSSDQSEGSVEETTTPFGNDDPEEGTALDGPAMTPYDERTTIFQFPGGKRTGTCWHEIMENLDFTQWEAMPTAQVWEPVEKSLVNYSQFGNATRAERIDAFQKMLLAVAKFPFAFPDETTPFRLCDVPRECTLREFAFTFMMREGIEAKDLAKLLRDDNIAVPEDWSSTIARQPLTGSIDFLLQEPKFRKFFILDWKTNIIGAKAENFTPEGVEAEVNRRFYSLQCVLYALAFMQYFRQFNHSANFTEEQREQYAKEAYDAFGGCADVFLRGLDADKHFGVHYVKPSWKLLNELDKRIGVIFQSSECK